MLISWLFIIIFELLLKKEVVKMKIEYDLLNFSASSSFTDGGYTLNFNWAELYHAAATLGKKSIEDVYSHGYFSIQELNFRFYMVKAFLCANNNFLQSSPAFGTLDPSEKAAINYFNGGILTKIFAGRCFDCPWLMHLDVYKNNLYNSGGVRIDYNASSNSRPDFVGLSSSYNDYSIFEAKGRQQYSSDAMEKAYNQTKNVKTVNSKLPRHKLGFLVYHKNESLHLKIKDPEESNKDAIIIKELLIEKFLYDYYAQVYTYINSHPHEEINENGINFIATSKNCHNITIGLESKTFKLMSNGIKPPKLFKEKLESNLKELPSFDKSITGIEHFFVGNDGILIKISEEEIVQINLNKEKMRK